jgi:hypothetical protein
MFITLSWRVALPLAFGFGVLVTTLNKLKFPGP